MRTAIKLLYTTFLFLLLSSISFAQNVWESKSDMPTARKELTDAAAVLDGKIYVMGGTTPAGAISNVFEVYDPGTDTWTALSPYPISVWRASLAALDGTIYGMGGYETLNPFPFSPTNKAYSYDPGTDTWSPIQDMISPRGSSSSVILDGKIHLVGGANTTALDTHHMYDPGNDMWSSVTNLNQERSGLTSAVVNGNIYAIGGYFLSGGVQSLSSAEEYDPGTGNWTTIANMPFTKLGISSGVIQGKLYVFGNENGTNVLEYDPTGDIWTELVAMPENVNFSGAASFNNLIYIIGGGEVNLATDGIAAVNCFNPAVLGIDDIAIDETVLIYPNPSSGTINLRLARSAATIRVLDITGAVIDEMRPGGNELNLSMALHFPSGFYFVEVLLEDGELIVQKIIKK